MVNNHYLQFLHDVIILCKIKSIITPVKTIFFSFRPDVAEILNQAADQNTRIFISGAFDDPYQFLKFIDSHKDINVVITNLLTPEYSGAQWIEKIRVALPYAIVVAYTTLESEFTTDILMKSGLTSVVHRRMGIDDLLKYIVMLYDKK